MWGPVLLSGTDAVSWAVVRAGGSQAPARLRGPHVQDTQPHRTENTCSSQICREMPKAAGGAVGQETNLTMFKRRKKIIQDMSSKLRGTELRVSDVEYLKHPQISGK